MANPGRHDLHQYLASARPLQVQLDNFQRLFGFKGYGSARFHGVFPSVWMARNKRGEGSSRPSNCRFTQAFHAQQLRQRRWSEPLE